MIDKLAVSLSYMPPSAGAGPSGPYQDCTWNVSLSRSDTKGIWKSIQVHADAQDSFRFSGCSPTGAMGSACADGKAAGYKIAAGAHVLVSSNGTALGEGVCCNGVSNGVVSAAKLSCAPAPPPAPPSPAAEQGPHGAPKSAGLLHWR